MQETNQECILETKVDFRNMKTVFLIVGETGSGKDSIVNRLTHDGYEQLISYATRPRRTNEGDTHIFIAKDDVEAYKSDIVAYTQIGEYEYFCTKSQLMECDLYIIDPNGVEYLKDKIKDIRFVTIYINVNKDERIHRTSIRGDKTDVVQQRIKSEYEQFKNFKQNADFDYSVCNYDIDKAYSIVKYIIGIERNLHE